MSTSSSWIRRAARNAALALGATALALLAGELALRAAGFSFVKFWQPDPLTGSRLRAGVQGWQNDEGRAFVHINSQGWRDREHPLAKPAGTYRIAILGDSYAEAMQVDIERTFWWLLPQKLAACGFAAPREIETLNFGVSGYGTGHELLTLRERVWAYDPDMVLLAGGPLGVIAVRLAARTATEILVGESARTSPGVRRADRGKPSGSVVRSGSTIRVATVAR